jgi:DNA repair exonuclease SbcCD ATPase subunit
VGANGIGKSIITDLLQMLFIYDSKDIYFGTDGIQKRKIETLPYNTNLAYCLLTVEVDKDKFFIMGITISSQSRRKITPFIITKQTDLTLTKEQLTLNADDLFFAEQVIQQDQIPSLTDFAKILLKSQNLYLTNFKTKEEIQNYYGFLYAKGILSLNLALEKNYRAFSKVIQSFSKVKTFHLDEERASDSLKDFLFEDSDMDFMNDFNKQQESLEKILKEYKRLSTDIESLKKKQTCLIELKLLNEQYAQVFKIYKTAEISQAYREKENIQTSIDKLDNDLSTKKEEYKKLKKTLAKLPKIKSFISAECERANSNYDNYSNYEQLRIEVRELGQNISDLESLSIPELHEADKLLEKSVSIANVSVQEITKEIKFAIPYIQKYKTVSNIEQEREEQNERLEELKSQLKAEKDQKQKLLTLLDKESKDSLIHWYINHQKTLSKEQLRALLHFASLPINKITHPENRAQFINPEKLFSESVPNQFENEGDYWIELGAISEYVAFEPDVALFEDKKNLEQSVQKLIAKLKQELDTIDSQFKELGKVSNAESYDENILKHQFDLSLIEFSNIKRIKKGISYILQLDSKIESLRSGKSEKETAQLKLEANFPQNLKSKTIEEIKTDLFDLRKHWNTRQTNITRYSERINATEPTLKADIQKLDDELTAAKPKLEKFKTEFTNLHEKYLKLFNEDITAYSFVDEKVLNELKEQAEETFKQYQSKYVSIVPLFEETKDNKNTAVNLEINKSSYSFRVLEEALLGSKIKSTDDITAALDEANQNRLNMADGIRDSMIKVFENTIKQYNVYKQQIKSINIFFNGRRISEEYFFKLGFNENQPLHIDLIDEMIGKVRTSAKQGELPFDQPISELIEEFFRKSTQMRERISIDKLLNPKSYFRLSAKLTDLNENEIPGSTGETYSAIALLGIARLSVAQKEQRPGLKFIILEELGDLDKVNFNTFPSVAKEFGYQIITMAPHVLNMGLEDEWYSHHLIKGKPDKNINLYPCVSYFKTKERREDLNLYISKLKYELD